jgi:hypothetical protein
LNDHLNKCGLFISAGKSASLKIDVDGKRKMWAAKIFQLNLQWTYEYLGVPLSAKGATPLSADKLQKYLDNLSRAPVKPQQRLYILKRHVIPALYHQLVLSDCSKRLFTFLDVKIRGAVKRWLKMPKNTSNFFIDALVKEGGLMATAARMARGVPSVMWRVMPAIAPSQ